MFGVFGVELVCSDEACAEIVEAIGDLSQVELLVCEGCGCTMQITAVWEVCEERFASPAGLLLAA